MSERNGSRTPRGLFAQAGSRRDFLRNTALTALAGGAVAGCVGMFGMVTALIVKDG
jgi:uncharacterized membrane-anchored protein